MTLYCRIDLHASNSVPAALDEGVPCTACQGPRIAVDSSRRIITG